MAWLWSECLPNNSHIIIGSRSISIILILVLLTWSQVLFSGATSVPVFDGQIPSVDQKLLLLQGLPDSAEQSPCDLSLILASIPVNEFVVVLVPGSKSEQKDYGSNEEGEAERKEEGSIYEPEDGQDTRESLQERTEHETTEDSISSSADMNKNQQFRHSEGHYEDLNGFLITITRHNKIMQIFTAQTPEWPPTTQTGETQEIVVTSSRSKKRRRRRKRRWAADGGQQDTSQRINLRDWNEEISFVGETSENTEGFLASSEQDDGREQSIRKTTRNPTIDDRPSDLMEQFRDDVGPFMADNINTNHDQKRPLNAAPRPPSDSFSTPGNIDSFLRSLSNDHSGLPQLPYFIRFSSHIRPGSAIILVIDNIQQLPSLSEILRHDMSAIKFVLFPQSPKGTEREQRMNTRNRRDKLEEEENFGESSTRDAPEKDEEASKIIETFMRKLWQLHSVYYVFFVGFHRGRDQSFILSSPAEALFYNPFVKNSGGGGEAQWGHFDKMPINCGLSNSLISHNNGQVEFRPQQRPQEPQTQHQQLNHPKDELVFSEITPKTDNESSGDSDGKGKTNNLEEKKYQKSVQEGRGEIHFDRDLLQNIISILNVGSGMNYQGYPLRGVLFEATMNFPKSRNSIMNRTMEGVERPFEDTFFGLDVTVSKELSRRLNFSLSARATSDGMDYGFQEENGTFNGALGDIIYRRADFSVNGFFIKDYLSAEVEFSTPSYSDKLCIIVRSADRIPDSLLIFKCFSVQVWIITAVTVLVVAIVYFPLSELAQPLENEQEVQRGATLETPAHPQSGERRKQFRRYFSGSFRQQPLNTASIVPRPFPLLTAIAGPGKIVAVLLSAPVTRIGTTAFERIFICFCMFWSLNLTGVFQGSLYDVYTNPKSYANIDSLAEMDRSGIPIVVIHLGLIVDVFGDEQPGSHLGNLRAKLQPSAMDFELVQRVANWGREASLERELNMDEMYRNHVRPDRSSYLHTVSECPRSYGLAYLMSIHSIYRDPINHYVGLFCQAGLPGKWMQDALFLIELDSEMQNREHVNAVTNILTLSHLQTAFYILFIGNILSLVVFIGEIYWKKRERDSTAA